MSEAETGSGHEETEVITGDWLESTGYFYKSDGEYFASLYGAQVLCWDEYKTWTVIDDIDGDVTRVYPKSQSDVLDLCRLLKAKKIGE